MVGLIQEHRGNDKENTAIQIYKRKGVYLWPWAWGLPLGPDWVAGSIIFEIYWEIGIGRYLVKELYVIEKAMDWDDEERSCMMWWRYEFDDDSQMNLYLCVKECDTFLCVSLGVRLNALTPFWLRINSLLGCRSIDSVLLHPRTPVQFCVVQEYLFQQIILPRTPTSSVTAPILCRHLILWASLIHIARFVL